MYSQRLIYRTVALAVGGPAAWVLVVVRRTGTVAIMIWISARGRLSFRPKHMVGVSCTDDQHCNQSLQSYAISKTTGYAWL